MNNFQKWWLGILTFMVVAETTLIGIYCCSKLEINSNSPSVLISALGVLVTFVVAWQIWQTMASREEIKETRKAIDEIKQLRTDLETVKSLFLQHNLEIKLLIDAHAKLQNVDYYETLSDKYLRYAEALEILIQSNIDFSYDKFDEVFDKMGKVLMELNSTKDPMEVWGFIEEENLYDRKYENILTTLAKREKDIDAFRQRLIDAKRLRVEAIRMVKESEMGKKVDETKKEWEIYKKEAIGKLREEAVEKAHQPSEQKDGEKQG